MANGYDYKSCFKIEGEKIVSAHYIKQNRCFIEVIKEIQQYEEASGAKVNYKKTKDYG